MKMITGNYKSEDGQNYYSIVLNLETFEYVQIKNAGCAANAETLALEYFNEKEELYSQRSLRVFLVGTCSELNLKFIPKKYHRYFNRKL